MKVLALISFSSFVGGELQVWATGDERELPPGTNWIELGMVAPVAPDTGGKTDAPGAGDLAQAGDGGNKPAAAGASLAQPDPEAEPDEPPAGRRAARKKASK